MKILHIFREDIEFPNYLIRCQLKTLTDGSIEVITLPIRNGGILGYLSAFFKIKKAVHHNQIELIHAHYGLTAFITRIATSKPVVCSIMGSEIFSGFFLRKLVKIFAGHFWNATIVKSSKMQHYLKLENINVIPNGVSLEAFYNISKTTSKKRLSLSYKETVLFVSVDPNSKVKNLSLAHEAIKLLNDFNIELQVISRIPISELVYFFNAADALILTSLSEGSPNVIKEAMACNCPIVSTDVGDVAEIIEGVEGCFLASFDPEDFAQKIKLALEFSRTKGRTKGRERIIQLGLDSETIANKLVEVYKRVLK